MKIIKGHVSTPKGFLASGLNCGIKKSGKHDLALILSETTAVTAGVFTKNSIIAAPLIVTKKKLKDNVSQAVIVNSGNANCFTGSFGLIYAQKTCAETAKLLRIQSSNVFVSSTGIIGKPLPFEKIQSALPKLVKKLSKTGGKDAAKGILTTDKVSKTCCVEIFIGGKKVTIGAIAKGSGMIEPNMATMLGFITTDAVISKNMLEEALSVAVNESFNCITVDGCMSTNDMVTIMANGQANNKSISRKGKDFETFAKALTYVCLDLAKKIVLDAEGATKFLKINISEARTKAQAKKIAMAIANSNLVKTAAYGSNPNWGRVAAAVGALGLNIKENQLKIDFSSFTKKNIEINVAVSLGNSEATVYTSDLSLDYVRINGKYN